jgi:hypothetical protein
LNLYLEPAKGFDLNISGAVALAGSVDTVVTAVKAILDIGLTALSFPPGAILYLIGLSSYSIIEDGQSITLGYILEYF